MYNLQAWVDVILLRRFHEKHQGMYVNLLCSQETAHGLYNKNFRKDIHTKMLPMSFLDLSLNF